MCDEVTVEIYNYNAHNRGKKPNIQLKKLRKNTRSYLYKLEEKI